MGKGNARKGSGESRERIGEKWRKDGGKYEQGWAEKGAVLYTGR